MSGKVLYCSLIPQRADIENAFHCNGYSDRRCSAFEAIFEEEYRRRDIKLFIPLPRSPKLNECVERAHRIHNKEFYEITACSFDIPESNVGLLEWENIYNTVRPHQSLDHLILLKFVQC